MNQRLRKLVELGMLGPTVVMGAHGAGPYAYALTTLGRRTLRLPRSAGPGGSVWHQLEIAEFRVRLHHALRHHHGELVEWIGDDTARRLLAGRQGLPVPDAVVHWRRRGYEGTFLLEWDRGSETLATLVAKLGKYELLLRHRGYRVLAPGLGLRPRIAVVCKTNTRAEQLLEWRATRRHSTAVRPYVGTEDEILLAPLAGVWRQSSQEARVSLFE